MVPQEAEVQGCPGQAAQEALWIGHKGPSCTAESNSSLEHQQWVGLTQIGACLSVGDPWADASLCSFQDPGVL